MFRSSSSVGPVCPEPLTVTSNVFVIVVKSDTASIFPFSRLSFALTVAVKVTFVSFAGCLTVPDLGSRMVSYPVGSMDMTLGSEDSHVILPHAVRAELVRI